MHGHKKNYRHFSLSPKEKQKQKEVFIAHIELAKKYKKPLIVHIRNASRDSKEILLSSNAKEVGGVLHCYNADEELLSLAKEGFYFGIGGVVTFKNAKKLLNVLPKIPMDRLLIETDGPYLTPMPHRGERNEPFYTTFIAQKISELLEISLENIMNQFISQNSCPQILIETHGFLPSKYSILLVKPWVKRLRFSTESDKLVVPILKKMTHRDEKTLFKEIMKVCKLSIDICNTLNELANSLKDAIYSFTTKVEELIEEYDIVYIVDPFSFLIEILEEINLFIKEGTSNIDNNSDLIKP